MPAAAAIPEDPTAPPESPLVRPVGPLARLHRVLDRVAAVALWSAAAGLVAMTAAIAWQVFGRYVLNDSPHWTEPGSLLLMSWFILLGAAVGVRESDHLGFEIGLALAPPKLRKAMQCTTFALITLFGLGMAFYGAKLAAGTWGATMSGLGIPQGVDYLPLVMGGLLIALFALEKLLQRLISREEG
ncbi:TRAP transporter small permease [Geminicoccus flavidas]|uniref:TRAP transporter small permease n=1 Tax=Geminicoccus flavidas TaxID=2506407 RepID=UPI00135A3B9F|nr:TRAP transporter small permease [Geminicoccus flavidas]